jgi:hypothetical protein
VSVSPIAGPGAGFAILHQRQQRAYLFDRKIEVAAAPDQ